MRPRTGPWLVAVAVVTAACSSLPASRTSQGALLGRSECAANRSAGTVTYVSPFGFDASAGILDVFAAQKLGYFADMCLGVDLVTNSYQSTSLVASGRATVSNIGSAADDLGEVALGNAVIAVATYGDVSDYALLTQPDVSDLRQLGGRTLAYHSPMPLMILEMLKAGGVPISSVNTVATQDYDPNQLVQGHETALQAYQSNEPLVLRAEGERFNEYVPSQFGIKGTFNVVIFNRGFYLHHRQSVADFLRAELHAFYFCANHQGECVGIEKQFALAAGSEYPVSHEQAVWRLEVGLAEAHTVAGGGVGVETQAEWRPEAAALRQYGLVDSVPDLARWEDTRLAASLYRGTTLVWP